MTSTKKEHGWINELPSEDQPGAFEVMFLKEVESAFTADIACCDSCYDDFLNLWPGAYRGENARFQSNSMDLDMFYSWSRMHQWFSKEDYQRLLPTMKCPSCGESFTDNFWAYELPFDPPDNHEEILTDIATLAKSRPFLLLSYDFCREVYDVIKKLASSAKPKTFDNLFFRGRSIATSPTIVDFEKPPAKVVREGRYNHAGDSVLYVASTLNTCKAEMRAAKDLRIISFKMSEAMKVLDLIDAEEAHCESKDLLEFLVYSALLSATSKDDGFSRPEYVFSRFIKDCALDAGFDAIKYPSTRVGEERFNLAIINPELTISRHGKDVIILAPS